MTGPDWHLVPGFWEDKHQAAYQWLLGLVPHGAVCAEVGCFRGRSLCSVAEIIKKEWLNIYAVDMFDDVEYTYDEADVLKNRKGMYTDFHENMRAFGLNTRVVSFPGRSTEQAEILSRNKNFRLDLVFIDAAHDYESVKADIAAWWPVVKPGGILSGHDYGPKWPGVVKAVQEAFPYKNDVIDEIWWTRKP